MDSESPKGIKYQAVIFDLFGTLVPSISRRGFAGYLEEIASILGAPSEDFKRLWMDTTDRRIKGDFPDAKANMRHVLYEIGVDPDNARLSQAAKVSMLSTRPLLEPRPDAEETLFKLRRKGFEIGLISDCWPDIPLVWPETPLALLIDAAVFSCDVKHGKPEPQIYQIACDRLGVNPMECLYIGDGGSGELAGAAQVGMSPVLIRVRSEEDDAYRPGQEEWSGPSISSLSDVLILVG